MSFAKFMSGPVGRGARIVAGLLLILIGIERGHVGGVVLTLVGIVPLLAGVTNVCLIAPVVRAPFSGRKLDQQR